jgi:hypothetical protein
MKVKIKEVYTKSDIKKFVRFPHKLYKGCKQYVPSLDADEISIITKSPSLEYCSIKLWLALDENESVVGRIAGIYNPHSNEFHSEKRVRFGWYDFIEDFDVARMLIEQVQKWGEELGMNEIHGPLSFNTWGKQGMMIEGFENIPPVNCIYNYSYYPVFMERMGFGKQLDWIQLKIATGDPIDQRIIRVNNMLIEKHKLKILDIRKIKDRDSLVKGFFRSYNESFKDIDNFAPMTDAEIENIGKEYFPKLKPELTTIVLDQDDNIAAFGICFPSLSRAFQKARGRLFPFGIFHILRTFKKYDSIDFMMIGAAPEWQHKGVTSIFHTHIGSNLHKMGVRVGITNPQAENNSAFKVWERYGTEPYMKRRCFIKTL